MLWLSLYFPQFPLELRQPVDDGAVAIWDRTGPRRWLIACNEIAREAGLHRGLDVTTALAQVPHLKIIERTKSQERTSLKALSAWAEQFSNTICFDADRWLLWVEIGTSLRYFNGIETLLATVERSIDALGYTTMIGVAPTLESAALFARHGYAKPVFTRQECNVVLATLPLTRLAINTTAIDALHDIGWKTIGDVLAIPRAQLAGRFGPEVTRYLQRLLGEVADPRVMFKPPARYQRCFDFSFPIDNVESMLFPLRRLLLELQGYLRGRDAALQTLQLTLSHEKAAATTITLQTTAPQRDAQRLFSLLREKLDRVIFSAPINAIKLNVSRFVSPGDTQLDLFDDGKKRDHGWGDLIDKLRARLGDKAVRRLGLANEHLPEKAWCVVTAASTQTPSEDYPDRPVWLMTPKPLKELPKLLGKPERIESGGWDEDSEGRDYYVARTSEGSRWWLYRDVKTSQWFLHGLWS